MKDKVALPFLAVLGRVALTMTIISIFVWNGVKDHRILLDTDMGTDDIFALLYLLRLNSSQINLQAVTIRTNAWSDAGHSVNQVYDMLYMMGRDDITVGVGSEGGILPDSTILPNVGGYLPMIDQGNGTAGYCRYKQAIPVGHGGRLDIDSNYGLRKSFLPQRISCFSSVRTVKFWHLMTKSPPFPQYPWHLLTSLKHQRCAWE